MPTTTYAVDIPAKGRVEIVDRELPDPRPGQALINVQGCGICRIDVERFEGRAGFSSAFQLGHEAWGFVEEMGPQPQLTDEDFPFGLDEPMLQIGDAVTGWIVGGAMAGHVIAEIRHLRRVPRVGIAFPEVHGEPLARVVNSVLPIPPKDGDTVVVVGAGFMGLVTAKLAALEGAGRIIVAARRPEQLERAEAWGATDVIDLREGDIARAALAFPPAHFVYEATGTPGELDPAWAAAARNPVVVGHDRQWRGHGLDQGLALVSSGVLHLDDLVTHPVPITEAQLVFDLAARRPRDYVKATINLSSVV